MVEYAKLRKKGGQGGQEKTPRSRRNSTCKSLILIFMILISTFARTVDSGAGRTTMGKTEGIQVSSTSRTSSTNSTEMVCGAGWQVRRLSNASGPQLDKWLACHPSHDSDESIETALREGGGLVDSVCGSLTTQLEQIIA